MKSFLLIFTCLVSIVIALPGECESKDWYYLGAYEKKSGREKYSQMELDEITAKQFGSRNQEGYLPTDWQYHRKGNMKWYAKKLAAEFPTKYIAATNRLAEYSECCYRDFISRMRREARREAEAKARADREIRESILNQEVLLRQIRNELYDRGW